MMMTLYPIGDTADEADNMHDERRVLSNTFVIDADLSAKYLTPSFNKHRVRESTKHVEKIPGTSPSPGDSSRTLSWALMAPEGVPDMSKADRCDRGRSTSWTDLDTHSRGSEVVAILARCRSAFLEGGDDEPEGVTHAGSGAAAEDESVGQIRGVPEVAPRRESPQGPSTRKPDRRRRDHHQFPT